DPILRPERVDSTLNAPTSAAWFDPWRQYLEDAQEVCFHWGRLVDFDFDDEKKRIVPRAYNPMSEELLDTSDADFFLIAAPLPVLLAERAAGGPAGLARRFMKVYEAHKKELDCADDFAKLATWADEIEDWNNPDHMPDNPLQHLTGVQFYFAENVLAKPGH